MTNLNIQLSAGMQALMQTAAPTAIPGVIGNGINGYAVYFDSSGAPVWSPLVADGSILNGGLTSVALPSSFNGGKVYILVQSEGTSADSQKDLETAITQQSDINWANAQSYSFRYDSFEVTLTGGGTAAINDVGNLTSVEGFGFPMGLSITYSNGTTATRGYNNPSPTVGAGDSIFTQIEATSTSQTVYGFADGSTLLSANYNRVAISPTQAVGLSPPNPAYSADQWSGYIWSMETPQAADVTITGFFNGAKDANGIWHNGGFYSYQLEWSTTDNVFWLMPTAQSQITGYIKVTPEDLQNSIYSTLGNIQVFESLPTASNPVTPYVIAYNTNDSGNPADINTGLNNQWGKVMSQFLTGFTAGFYGAIGFPENSGVNAIDLNKNYNWDPRYSFGTNVTYSEGIQHFNDAYSKVYFYGSNSYGSGYSDSLMSQYSVGGPLISVYDPGNGSTVSAGDVANINLTIFADNEQATGYVTPVIYNYLAPTSGAQYSAPTVLNTSTSVTLNFASLGMILSESVPIYLQILTGYNAGVPVWDTVQLVQAGYSPWQEWVVSGSSGAYSATVAPGTGQTAGSLVISSFPTAAAAAGANTTSWYRIVVGDTPELTKTYNLYITTNSSGEFVNAANSIAIDGLATFAPGALYSPSALQTFSINFMPGSTLTFDPAFVTQTADSNYSSGVLPFAPVAGTLSSGAFSYIAGQTAAVNTGSSAAVGEGDVVFGWTGDNPTARSAIGGITNKTMGLNVALLSFTQTGGASLPAINPLAVASDLDGQWQSVVQSFGNGTYTVTMREYAPGDTTHAAPLSPSSSILSLTVNMTSLALRSTAHADGIELVPDAAAPETKGNWIHFQSLTDALPASATLLLYATNAAGQMIDASGRVTTNLLDAVIGHVGSVKSDAGQILLDGSHSVHLAVGEQLHFALQTGGGAPVPLSDASVVTHPDGSLSIDVGGLHLTAATNNTLDASEQLASAARTYGMPLVYAEHGDSFTVDVVGSSANVNTLAFVRFDIDAKTGAISLDGVAYGNTADFDAAVRSHLDSGYQTSRGGDFSASAGWTVAGEDGFYAPVLLNAHGDVFVVGTANPDGHEHIRAYGSNTYGFEDLTAAQGSDFDYNDMVMKLSFLSHLA